MTISQRISGLIGVLGLKISSFAKEIGVKDATIRKAIERDSEPRSGVIAAILSKYDKLNPYWLIDGQGEMWKADEIKQLSLELQKAKEEMEKLSDQLESAKGRIESMDIQITSKDTIILRLTGLVDKLKERLPARNEAPLSKSDKKSS